MEKSMEKNILEMRGISKSFPGVKALDNVCLKVKYGCLLYTSTAVPGAAACITALTISGLATRRFAFEAFLPTDKKERQAILEELKGETRTMVLYEAPHRLARTLKVLYEALGNRRISVCRELTKKHETVFATTIEDALDYYESQEDVYKRQPFTLHVASIKFICGEPMNPATNRLQG